MGCIPEKKTNNFWYFQESSFYKPLNDGLDGEIHEEQDEQIQYQDSQLEALDLDDDVSQGTQDELLVRLDWPENQVFNDYQ